MFFRKYLKISLTTNSNNTFYHKPANTSLRIYIIFTPTLELEKKKKKASDFWK